MNLCPAERARHGWRALDLPARAGEAERSKSRVHPQGQARIVPNNPFAFPPSMEVRGPFEGPAEATEAMGNRSGLPVKAQVKMVLVTFAETKVTRVRGRRPVSTVTQISWVAVVI